MNNYILSLQRLYILHVHFVLENNYVKCGCLQHAYLKKIAMTQ